MAYRTLEVTLISAKDLNDVNLFSRMEVYAVVSLSGDPRSRQRTKPDREGGRNPSWNSTLRFNVPADDYGRQVVHILLRAERALGDRDVGEVHIPLSELLDAGAGNGPKFVSYQVRKCTSGKPKGLLNLSYKIGEKITAPAPAPPAAYPPPAGFPKSGQPLIAHRPAAAYTPPANVLKVDEPVTAYPTAGTSSAAYPPYGAQPYTPPANAPRAEKPVTAYPAPGSSSAAYPPYGAQPYTPPANAPRADEPVTAYPAPGSSSAAYPPYGAQPYPPPAGYAPPPYGYAPPPQQAGYGYPPVAYGYGAAPPMAQPRRKNNFGLGLGAGLLGGALGGLLIGDMVSDAGAYDAGYDAGFDDGGGFDF